jgi:hypothetical protein
MVIHPAIVYAMQAAVYYPNGSSFPQKFPWLTLKKGAATMILLFIDRIQGCMHGLREFPGIVDRWTG